MKTRIRELFIDPPLAIARLGGSFIPQDAYGYPGQDLVWPGVLLLGYPATSPDPLIPGQPAAATPALNSQRLVSGVPPLASGCRPLFGAP